jgi:acyl-CoA thioesterase-1
MNVMQVFQTGPAQVVRWIVAVNLALLLCLPHAWAAEGGKPVRVVAFGDSLTAGLGLPPSEAFPAQLERSLKAKGLNVAIANAGVSGDTTAAGLERFDWAIPDDAEAVILELGANDALRGMDPNLTRTNLDKILSRLREKNIEVLLTGMMAPKNWGAPYEDEFNVIYKDLAAKYGTLLYPFFLDGVATKANLNQDDGLHPSSKGVGVIVERIMPSVEQLITRVEARRLAAASP